MALKALVLSGGAFRGAIQVPIIEHLRNETDYDIVYGVSVGSINGVMFAQDKLPELRTLWENVNGVRAFLTPKYWWPFNGLHSMKPLRKRVEQHSSLAQLKIPFIAGVVSQTDGAYYNLDSRKMSKDKELWDSIEASSSITGIMVNPTIEIEGHQHIVADGGFRNIIPVPPPEDYSRIDIVTCTSLQRIYTKIKLQGIWNKIARSVEITEDEIFHRDLVDILCMSNQDAQVTLYSPEGDVGRPFDARKETIEYRFKLGEAAIKNPIIISN